MSEYTNESVTELGPSSVKLENFLWFSGHLYHSNHVWLWICWCPLSFSCSAQQRNFAFLGRIYQDDDFTICLVFTFFVCFVLSLSLWALWTYLVISNSSHFVFCFPFFLVAIRLYQLYYRNGAAEWQNQRKLVQNQNGFKRTKYKMRPKRRREKEIRHKIIRKSTSKMKNRRSSLVLVWQLSNDTTDGNQNIKISTE